MRELRASQTPERRSEISRMGRAAQRNDDWERFKARLRVLADTEEQRWWLAFQYGRKARNTQDYRQRKVSARWRGLNGASVAGAAGGSGNTISPPAMTRACMGAGRAERLKKADC